MNWIYHGPRATAGLKENTCSEKLALENFLIIQVWMVLFVRIRKMYKE